MDEVKYTFKRLDEGSTDEMTRLFTSVFTREPWNDDWSDKEQLRLYIHDLIGQENSLTFGLYEDGELVGLSMGRVKHWYTGTEYCVDELCVRTDRQGHGLGAMLVERIEDACRELGLTHIFLLTESDVPAFGFYKRQGFYQLENNVALAKDECDNIEL